MVGWSQLRDAVHERRAQASANGAAQWQKVLDLVERRIERGAAETAPPLYDQEWHLVTVHVDGFRGIGGKLTVHLEPSPGLTVVHAPNGSGKSSLAEAVQRALGGASSEGVPRPKTLWHPHDQAAGRDRSSIEVLLSSGSDQLSLCWDSEQGLSPGTGARTANGWSRCRTRPGAELRSDVAEHADEARSAAERLKQAKYDAQGAVAAVDQRYLATCSPHGPPTTGSSRAAAAHRHSCTGFTSSAATYCTAGERSRSCPSRWSRGGKPRWTST